jgi:hypothetical protein
MFVDSKCCNQFCNIDYSIFLEEVEDMIDGCYSFLCDIVANIGHKQKIVDSVLMWEVIFDYSYFLACEEDAGCVEEEIEGVFGEAALFAGVESWDLGVEVQQVLVGAAEELEFELVVYFCQGVDPVHCSYNY